MSDEILIVDRNYEKYNGLDIKAKFYDGISLPNFNAIDGSVHIVQKTLAEVLPYLNSFTPHPLGQCTFYYGRTSFNVDSLGYNRYHWSTTNYNVETALYAFTTEADGTITPSIVGWGANLGITQVEGLEGFTEFYYEDLDMGSPPDPAGYNNIGGLLYPYWDWSVWPGIDFYGRNKYFHIIGDMIYIPRIEGAAIATKWSRMPEAILIGTWGASTLYWVPEYRKVTFTEILYTIQRYRRPRISYSTSANITWNPITNEFFDTEFLSSGPASFINARDDGQVICLPTDSFFVNNNKELNNSNVVNNGINGYSVNANNFTFDVTQDNYIGPDPTFGTSPVYNLTSNQFTIDDSVYFDYNYTKKDVIIEDETISIMEYIHTGYTALGYQIPGTLTSGLSSEIFQLNKKRLNASYLMINQDPINVRISGSIIRNKSDFVTNEQLDLNKVFTNGNLFFNHDTEEQIAFTDSQSLAMVSTIRFNYENFQNNQSYSETVIYTNDENASGIYYDFNVTILNNGTYDYYSDNESNFDGGGFGAITGSGTVQLTNAGNEGNFLMFNGSGLTAGITLDTYQIGRANIKATERIASGEVWRNNHLSPLFSLTFNPNSGLVEKPSDAFHTIQDMISDNNKLFVVGNRVGVLSKLTIGNSGDYTDKVFTYNTKIADCI